MTKSYKDLFVWQKAYKLSLLVYEKTAKFPRSETYSLTQQVRRSAISIPSNIAEGYYRGSKKEYINFLHIAYGSGAELETQVLLAKDLRYLEADDFDAITSLLSEVMKMLNTLIAKIKSGS
jgi:four helix bundle protein